MTQEQDKDSEFDAYLQGKSALSDAYADLPHTTPSSHLDAAILAEAHRAVGARPGGRPRRSWVFPVSMAASLFVVVIIGAQLRYLPMTGSPQTARDENDAGGKPEQEMRKTENVAVPSKPAAAPVPAGAEQKAAAPAEPLKEEAFSRESTRQRAAESDRVADNKPMAAAPAAAAPAPLPETQEVTQEVRAAPESAPGEAAKKQARNERELGAARSVAPLAAFSAAPAAPVASQPDDAVAAATVNAANPRPEEWLARIRQLKQQGKLDEAKKELAAFKRRYPAYTLPKDIDLR